MSRTEVCGAQTMVAQTVVMAQKEAVLAALRRRPSEGQVRPAVRGLDVLQDRKRLPDLGLGSTTFGRMETTLADLRARAAHGMLVQAHGLHT